MTMWNPRAATVCARLILLVTCVACGGASSGNDASPSSTIRILNAVVPESPTDPASAYIHIQNRGDDADRLIGVQSDAAKTVELHETRASGLATTMVRIDALEIPAHGDFTMQPGGYHLMLVDLTRPLHVGGEVAFTLTFERVGAVEVVARVVDATSLEPSGAGSRHNHQ